MGDNEELDVSGISLEEDETSVAGVDYGRVLEGILAKQIHQQQEALQQAWSGERTLQEIIRGLQAEMTTVKKKYAEWKRRAVAAEAEVARLQAENETLKKIPGEAKEDDK